MNEHHTQHLTIRTPGKLILSGEHAVLYGCPAIGQSVNRYLDVTIRWLKLAQWSFELLGMSAKKHLTLANLVKIKHKIKRDYEHFKLGRQTIGDVLKNPLELSLYTVGNVIDRFRRHLPNGIGITTQSNIPVGCGMGSSAACVVGLIEGMSQFLELALTLEDYIDLGIASENLQHGRSSGLDVYLAHKGGCQMLQNGTCTPLTWSDSWSWQLIHTGQPLASTGECVAAAKPHMTPMRLNQFEQCTLQMQRALEQNDAVQAQHTIQENHRLLQAIDVVPNRVAHFIEECEHRGMSGKICGAGSSRGEHGGMVLLLGNEDISDLYEHFGYTPLDIAPTERGCHVL